MARSLTVRLPENLYEMAREVARRREISLNELVQQGLEALAKQEQDANLYEAFGLLGEDAAEANVEFALPAQREIVAGGRKRISARRKPRTR